MAMTETAPTPVTPVSAQSIDAAMIASEAKSIRAAVDAELSALMAAQAGPPDLSAAMGHGLLAPAKRVRSILLVLTADRFAVPRQSAIRAATAVELVHASSLVFDDLPAMDDATLRRGQPTTHRAYGDATAILAAVSLLNAGYEVLAQLESITPDRRCQSVGLLTKAIGPAGLCGGQYRDLACEGASGVSDLECVHAGKTGALFAAAMAIGAAIGAPHSGAARAFWDVGMSIGLAFQGFDDLLDVYATSAATGKDAGLDDGKATIASLLGREGGEAWAQTRLNDGLSLLAANGHARSTLSDYIRTLAAALTAPLSGQPSHTNQPD